MICYLAGLLNFLNDNFLIFPLDITQCSNLSNFPTFSKLSIERMKKFRPKSMFLDSGAFSVKSGKEGRKKGATVVDLKAYCAFLKENKQLVDVYSNLDVIGDAEATWVNQEIMEAEGLAPLPTFHQNEDWEWLDRCLEYDYFALGGMATPATKISRIRWLDECFARICDPKTGLPRSKVHGFGLTDFVLANRYPWYSVDGTSWFRLAAFGKLLFPQTINGQVDYTQVPYKITISDRHADKEGSYNKHYLSFPKALRDEIEKYAVDRRMNISDLMSKHYARLCFNAHFVLDFEKRQPPWPKSWVRKRNVRAFV